MDEATLIAASRLLGLNGTFDNLATMQRERYRDGKLCSRYSAEMVEQNSSRCWGSWPDHPLNKGEGNHAG